MPASDVLLSVSAPVTWSIGPLTMGGAAVYVIVGLIVLVVLLLLLALGGVMARRNRMRRPRHTSGVSGNRQSETGPVPARAEWLLFDNTLVRMRAVRRDGSLLPADHSPPDTARAEDEGDAPLA